jgi:hypothetical protein
MHNIAYRSVYVDGFPAIERVAAAGAREKVARDFIPCAGAAATGKSSLKSASFQ